MADADPENEIRDVKRPKDRPLDTRDHEPIPHLIGPGSEADQNDRAKKSHQRIKPEGREAQGLQKVSVYFPFSLKVHFNIASTDRSLSAACRDLPAISFRETSARAVTLHFPDRSSPQTQARTSGTIAHRRV